jgi:hypothetical protein
MQPAHPRVCTRPLFGRHHSGDDRADRFDDGYDSQGRRSTSGTFFLLLTMEAFRTDIDAIEDTESSCTSCQAFKLLGLIQEPALENPITYKEWARSHIVGENTGMRR